jgi:hypothetical protein
VTLPNVAGQVWNHCCCSGCVAAPNEEAKKSIENGLFGFIGCTPQFLIRLNDGGGVCFLVGCTG